MTVTVGREPAARNDRTLIEGRHQLDGFHLLSGLAAVIAGPVMLAAGSPVLLPVLTTVLGLVVLACEWAIAT
jgi:hypothetical protein